LYKTYIELQRYFCRSLPIRTRASYFAGVYLRGRNHTTSAS